MKEEKFTVEINATAEKVWQTLWNDNTYMQWVSAFYVGSYAKSDWKQGSKIHFLSGGKGMYSEIALIEPNQRIVFQHIGEVIDHQEQPVDDKTSKWSGSKESYRLTELNGVTQLEVTIELSEEYVSYFSEVFPKALAIVKELAEKQYLTVAATIDASIEKVWDYWTNPIHIVKWNQASEDWHTTKSNNDLQVGGQFSATMAAKDGSMSFDFGGTYTEVKPHEKIAYTLGDGRNVIIIFCKMDDGIKIVESFEAEKINALELQQGGWQAIINSFKKYTESGQ